MGNYDNPCDRDGGLDQDGNRGSGEKFICWMCFDSSSTGFADRLDMECDSKEIRENSIT